MAILSTPHIITLSLLDGVGNKTIQNIVEVIKVRQLTIETPYDLCDFLSMAKANKLVPRLKEYTPEEVSEKFDAAKRTIDLSLEQNIHVVTFLDDTYPLQLLKTVDEKGNPSVPIVLYYKGDISVASLPGLAVIGTREPTGEGERIGEYLASEFASRGFNIVSGLALGCDTCGHRGALNVGGKTTAFLGHGLHTTYPPQNENLASEILEKGGLLMSEYPIYSSLTAYNLVARDRLQSGLSKATLVIQTSRTGGTMHAVHSTLAAQKPLYVVKYDDKDSLESVQTQGNEYLASLPNGAKYICETDNIENIANEIKNYQPFKTSLFD